MQAASYLAGGIETVSAGFSSRRRELVVATVTVGGIFGGVVCAEDHGAQGRKTSSDYGDGRLNHGDGAC